MARSTPTPSITDGYLNDLGEHHTEIELALEKAIGARNEAIVVLAPIMRVANGDIPGLDALVIQLARLSDALHVAGVSIGQARVSAQELWNAPAIKRSRRQAWDGDKERRQKERREARAWHPQDVAA